MKNLYFFIAVSLSVSALNACSKENEGSPNTGGGALDCSPVTNKSFVADINPVIQSSCATTTACHGSGSVNGPGALTSYQAVFNSRNSQGQCPKTAHSVTARKIRFFAGLKAGHPTTEPFYPDFILEYPVMRIL